MTEPTRIEQGTVHLFYRPRVERHQPRTLDDVQRMLIVLLPASTSSGRVVAIGRKKIPRPEDPDPRFWGWVEIVARDAADLQGALCERRYQTKTRGERHLPECRRVADGIYRIESHGAHAHLLWILDLPRRLTGPSAELGLESRADFILAVVNPATLEAIEIEAAEGDDAASARLHVLTPFPRRLQERFGDRRFATLDTPEFLNYEGAELIFIAVPRKSRKKIEVGQPELEKARRVEFGVG